MSLGHRCLYFRRTDWEIKTYSSETIQILRGKRTGLWKTRRSWWLKGHSSRIFWPSDQNSNRLLRRNLRSDRLVRGGRRNISFRRPPPLSYFSPETPERKLRDQELEKDIVITFLRGPLNDCTCRLVLSTTYSPLTLLTPQHFLFIFSLSSICCIRYVQNIRCICVYVKKWTSDSAIFLVKNDFQCSGL